VPSVSVGSSIIVLGSLTEIKILSKHEVSFEEAKTIFDDSLYVEFYAPNYLEGVDIMLVKGIKKGKIIELLEAVDFPNNEDVLVEIREVNDFWSAWQDFRQRVDLTSLDDDTLDNLRDNSTGRDVHL
jgi:hypothetical protein